MAERSSLHVPTLAGTVLLAVLVAVAGFISYQRHAAELKAKLILEERHHVEIQAAVLHDDLRHVAHSLSFLRDQLQAHGFLASPKQETGYARDLVSFLQSNGLYDQIRFLDNSGMELLRVNNGENGPYVVPVTGLQFKGEREYFRAAVSMDAGALYVSPLDLNVEFGEVEQPPKPVIRFAMPVFDWRGNRHGVLVVNHLAADMLKRFSQASGLTRSKPMLLNSRGFWLLHPDAGKEWGFMYAGRQHIRAQTLLPRLWETLADRNRGSIELDGSIYSFSAAKPFASFAGMQRFSVATEIVDRQWWVVSVVPARLIEQWLTPARNRTTTAVLSLMLLIMVAGIYLSGLRKQRLEDLERLHLQGRALDSATGGILICECAEASNPIIYCNSGFERLSGYRQEQLFGKDFRFHINADNDPAEIARLDAAIEGGRAVQILVRCTRKDGSLFWSEMAISPVYVQTDVLTHFVAFQMDVSQRKRADEEREQLLKEVRNLSLGLMEAREQERSDIARTLHDEIGQMITAIQLRATLSARLCRKHKYEEAAGSVEKISKMANGLIDVVRNQLNRLKVGNIEQFGLLESVRMLADQWRQHADIDVVLHLEERCEMLEKALQIALFRLIQESLTNVVRHAGATRAEVEVVVEDDAVRLQVSDDGAGFDPQDSVSGMGVAGMRERVQALHGSFHILSAPGEGTTLRCRIPL